MTPMHCIIHSKVLHCHWKHKILNSVTLNKINFIVQLPIGTLTWMSLCLLMNFNALIILLTQFLRNVFIYCFIERFKTFDLYSNHSKMFLYSKGFVFDELIEIEDCTLIINQKYINSEFNSIDNIMKIYII